SRLPCPPAIQSRLDGDVLGRLRGGGELALDAQDGSSRGELREDVEERAGELRQVSTLVDADLPTLPVRIEREEERRLERPSFRTYGVRERRLESEDLSPPIVEIRAGERFGELGEFP